MTTAILHRDGTGELHLPGQTLAIQHTRAKPTLILLSLRRDGDYVGTGDLSNAGAPFRPAGTTWAGVLTIGSASAVAGGRWDATGLHLALSPWRVPLHRRAECPDWVLALCGPEPAAT